LPQALHLPLQSTTIIIITIQTTTPPTTTPKSDSGPCRSITAEGRAVQRG
jgi:hypothetical protein